jgi:hypothetical protein
MVGLKPEATRSIMSVVEVGIQGCPLDVYFASLLDSGLFFKIAAAVIDDNVPLPRLQLIIGKWNSYFTVHEYLGENCTSKSRIIASCNPNDEHRTRYFGSIRG